jgi:AbrB family looped-hinge helix DNA binding protein
MHLTLDKMGRLVVPKPLRDRFTLKPGDALEVTLEPDGFKLRPVHPAPAMSLKEGILVCTSEVPLSVWEIGSFIDQQREERNRELGGL